MLQLLRVCETPTATIGILLLDMYPKWVTLELPWRDNEHCKSCIPTGAYKCQRLVHQKFGVTFQVLDVENRDGIFFHVGNYAKDTTGCILLGLRFGGSRRNPQILLSKDAMSEFGQLVLSEMEYLEIINLKDKQWRFSDG